MFESVIKIFPYSHQPYLALDDRIIFAASEGTVQHQSGDRAYHPWRLFVSDGSSLFPIILPSKICCNPVLMGSSVSYIGGTETDTGGFEYHLFRCLLSAELYPMQIEKVIPTWTGFCFPFNAYLLDNKTKVSVEGADISLSKYFSQVFRLAPICDRPGEMLITGLGRDGEPRTGLFSRAKDTLFFRGWVLSSTNQHVYKSTLKGDTLIHAIRPNGGSFDDRQLTVDTGWKLLQEVYA